MKWNFHIWDILCFSPGKSIFILTFKEKNELYSDIKSQFK